MIYYKWKVRINTKIITTQKTFFHQPFELKEILLVFASSAFRWVKIWDIKIDAIIRTLRCPFRLPCKLKENQ